MCVDVVMRLAAQRARSNVRHFSFEKFRNDAVEAGRKFQKLHEKGVVRLENLSCIPKAVTVFMELNHNPMLKSFDPEDFLVNDNFNIRSNNSLCFVTMSLKEGARHAYSEVSTLMISMDVDSDEPGLADPGSRRDNSRRLKEMVSPTVYTAMKASLGDLRAQGQAWTPVEFKVEAAWINAMKTTEDAGVTRCTVDVSPPPSPRPLPQVCVSCLLAHAGGRQRTSFK